MSSNLNDVRHHEIVGISNFKVSIEEVLDPKAKVSIPSYDVSKVHEAEGLYVAWPCKLVVLHTYEILENITYSLFIFVGKQ